MESTVVPARDHHRPRLKLYEQSGLDDGIKIIKMKSNQGWMDKTTHQDEALRAYHRGAMPAGKSTKMLRNIIHTLLQQAT